MKTYHAVPASECHVPGRTFGDRRQALTYAQAASRHWHVTFAVWRIERGRMRLLKRFQAYPRRA